MTLDLITCFELQALIFTLCPLLSALCDQKRANFFMDDTEASREVSPVFKYLITLPDPEDEDVPDPVPL